MSDSIPIVSLQEGHRWIDHDQYTARCADCGERWPKSGDLAPMPTCEGPERVSKLIYLDSKAKQALRRVEFKLAELLKEIHQ